MTIINLNTAHVWPQKYVQTVSIWLAYQYCLQGMWKSLNTALFNLLKLLNCNLFGNIEQEEANVSVVPCSITGVQLLIIQ